MKHFIFSFLFFGISTLTFGQNIKMPAASPAQTIKQDFALSSIELSYSRPGLKGRTLFGNQIPWNVVWRTGANSITKITFNDDVEVLGHPVAAGTYGIYTIPRENGNWTFILNKNAGSWGVDGYDAADDLFRESVQLRQIADKAETMTMQFQNISPESCVLVIRWANFALMVPIKAVGVNDKVRAGIQAALNTDSEKKPYFQAATFYREYDNNNEKALEMVNAALVQDPDSPYWVRYYKAKILQELGRKNEAITAAREALSAAEKADSQNYIILNNALLKELQEG